MKRSEILARARLAAEKSRALYRLGSGGFDPKAPLPDSKAGRCDCSGFAAWAMGERRQTTTPLLVKLNGGWIETTAIVKDAKTPDGMFTVTNDPKPGDLIVWGDNAGRQGHVGIISHVVNGRAEKVIHCSSGNQRKFGKAIAETPAGFFYAAGAICVRFDGVEES